MREIKAYRTVDGKIFEKKKEADEHERECLVKEALRELVDREGYDGMSKDDIADLMWEYEEIILEIFNGKV
jgi:hypothetical protein